MAAAHDCIPYYLAIGTTPAFAPRLKSIGTFIRQLTQVVQLPTYLATTAAAEPPLSMTTLEEPPLPPPEAVVPAATRIPATAGRAVPTNFLASAMTSGRVAGHTATSAATADGTTGLGAALVAADG